MSAKGAESGSGTRIIKEIVVTYRLEGDEEGMERSFRITNSGGGQAVDGVVWSDLLIQKLNYDENGRCVPVGKQNPGKGQWRTTLSAEADEGGEVAG
ncbi:MAG: hypothetical protein ACREK1_03810, partial [Longimicrobiales bacterium]